MAYGQFTDYEPLPDLPGAYSFKTGDGRALTFGGPEADQLKARLDAARAATATAGNGMAGGFDQMGGYGASELAPPGGGSAPAPFDAKGAAAELAGAPIPASAQAAAPAQPGGGLGYGMRVSPGGTIQKFAPGSAGVSKEQLQKADENAVAVRRGETAQVQEGTPQSQEYLDARAEQSIDQRQALQQQGDREAAAAQAESDLAQRQFEQGQRMQAEEAARQLDLQSKFQREEALQKKAFAEYTSSKVEPGRIYADPAKRFITSLAAAAGAYAATIAKTPNFAQQIIDQSIDRDIHAQEAAIRLKGEKASNLLSNLRQTGMSIDQSRAVAKGIQLQNSQMEVAALRAKNAMPALQSHYENLDLALQKSLLEANEQSRLASIDKVARSTQSGFEHARAGSAGGWVDVKDQLGAAKEIQGLQKGEAEIAKMNRDGTKGPTASPEKRQAMSALADATNLEKSLNAYGDDYVPPVTENRNIIGRKIEGAIDSIAGKGSGARATLNDEERRSIQDYSNAQQTISSLQSVLGGQGALSGAERDAALAGLSPGATMGEVKRAVAMLRSRAETKLVAADATGEAGGTVVTK